MDEKKKKIYAGTGRKVNGFIRGISVCLDDIQNYATKSKNGKFYVSLDVIDLKEPNQWGKDVEVVVNQWKPDGRKSTTEAPKKYPNTPENFIDDSSELIPF